MITNYTGISGSRTAYQIASLTGTGDTPGNLAGAQALSEEPGKGRAGAAPANTVLIVVSSGKAAERLGRDLSFCAPDAGILIVPEEDDIQILYEAKNRESQVARVQALQALCTGTHDAGAGRLFIIAPVSAVVRLTESPERFIDGAVNVAVGDVGGETINRVYNTPQDEEMKAKCEAVKNKYNNLKSNYMKFELLRISSNSSNPTVEVKDVIAIYELGNSVQ